MLRAWLLWLLAAACCALAFAFTHAGAALAALCVPVLAALAGLVVLRCSKLPALSLRLPAGGRKDGMIAGEIAASRRAPGRVRRVQGGRGSGSARVRRMVGGVPGVGRAVGRHVVQGHEPRFA